MTIEERAEEYSKDILTGHHGTVAADAYIQGAEDQKEVDMKTAIEFANFIRNEDLGEACNETWELFQLRNGL